MSPWHALTGVLLDISDNRTFYITGLDEQQSLHKISENIFMDGWMDGWIWTFSFSLYWINFGSMTAISQQLGSAWLFPTVFRCILFRSVLSVSVNTQHLMWNSRKHPNLQLFTKLCIPTNTGLPSAFSSKESCFITHSYSLLQPNYCITTRGSKECISVSYNWSSERMFFI